jgi:hypothetical protein
MTSIIKVDQIQNAAGVGGLTIDSNGIVNLSNTVMFDIYTLQSNFGTDGGVITDWGKPTSAIYAASGVGDLMSISSGVFTFPKTGVYKISYFGTVVNNSGDNQTALTLQGTNDNSTYARLTYTPSGFSSTGSQDISVVSGEVLVNINDVSNRKVRMIAESVTSGSLITGDTADARTSISFQWLAPAQ